MLFFPVVLGKKVEIYRENSFCPCDQQNNSSLKPTDVYTLIPVFCGFAPYMQNGFNRLDGERKLGDTLTLSG